MISEESSIEMRVSLCCAGPTKETVDDFASISVSNITLLYIARTRVFTSVIFFTRIKLHKQCAPMDMFMSVSVCNRVMPCKLCTNVRQCTFPSNVNSSMSVCSPKSPRNMRACGLRQEMCSFLTPNNDPSTYFVLVGVLVEMHKVCGPYGLDTRVTSMHSNGAEVGSVVVNSCVVL